MWSYSERSGWKFSLYTGIGSNCFIMQIATVPRDRLVSRQREGRRERVINPPRVVVRLSSHRTVENPKWKIGKNPEERAAISAPFVSRRSSLAAAT